MITYKTSIVPISYISVSVQKNNSNFLVNQKRFTDSLLNFLFNCHLIRIQISNIIYIELLFQKVVRLFTLFNSLIIRKVSLVHCSIYLIQQMKNLVSHVKMKYFFNLFLQFKNVQLICWILILCLDLLIKILLSMFHSIMFLL